MAAEVAGTLVELLDCLVDLVEVVAQIIQGVLEILQQQHQHKGMQEEILLQTLMAQVAVAVVRRVHLQLLVHLEHLV
jgi:hypothetical protein